ncbi:YdhR family protein [Puniceicoccaceae bacterium K14]|nr:YdhR family protein [Puniceicoccaceae bacterium K14]
MSKDIKKVLLYGEVQINVEDFTPEVWGPINEKLKKVEGLIRKTWLTGINTNTLGGLYEFDSVENAVAFSHNEYIDEGRDFGVTISSKIFDGDKAEAASRDMNSPQYD